MKSKWSMGEELLNEDRIYGARCDLPEPARRGLAARLREAA
jgi:hypothetical protein